jgi:exodeoxyribonuclease VII small subunit
MNPELTFEDLTAKLEAIASRLERGDVPLEEALKLFEEGIALNKLGNARLDAAERKIEVLLKDSVAPLTDAG